MNANEFAVALNGLINSALSSGGSAGLSAAQIVGTIECAKLDVVRAMQDHLKTQQPAIVKANRLPPGDASHLVNT